MTKEEYKKLVTSSTKSAPTWQPKVASYIVRCARSVGGLRQLSEIVGSPVSQLRRWRNGSKMKATSALDFELSFNANQEKRVGGSDESLFRCDRKKLIPWFFE